MTLISARENSSNFSPFSLQGSVWWKILGFFLKQKHFKTFVHLEATNHFNQQSVSFLQSLLSVRPHSNEHGLDLVPRLAKANFLLKWSEDKKLISTILRLQSQMFQRFIQTEFY